ncbi:MAG: hypothetical protein ABJQ90_00040, partial [Parasphingorhabdus sp.]
VDATPINTTNLWLLPGGSLFCLLRFACCFRWFLLRVHLDEECFSVFFGILLYIGKKRKIPKILKKN